MPDAVHEHDHYRPPPVNARGRAYDPDATDDERTYALFMHLTLLGHVVVSLLAIIAPVIMWQVKKDQSPFLDDHGREAVNFQLSLIILSILLIPIGIITCSAGFFLYIPLYVLAIVGMIQAAIAANRGEFYRYPMTFRIV
jgi:hypothetical protein